MSSFHNTLGKFHRRWCFGRVLLILLLLVAAYAVAMLLHGWLDYKFAFSQETREKYNLILFVILGVVGLTALVQTLRIPREKIAALADEKLSDPRKRILAAASLEKLESQPDATEMQKFHLDRALLDASTELDKLPASSRMPFRAMGLSALAVFAIGAVIWGISHWAPEPFRVVSTRVLDPSSDLPPYSPLRFEITPDAPRAVYGGEAVVQVKITGGEIEHDVVCLIRDPLTGNIEQATAYREGKTGYARKFENALAPVEFAFATGRARSDWHRLDVLLEPKVSSAMITVTPPAYTGRAELTYPLEGGEIKALEGSTITLALESNRPLSSGKLELKALDKGKDARVEKVDGNLTGEHGVRFSWVAHRSSKVAAVIHDVRATPSAKPLELTITTEPDQVPSVELASPEQMVLATPNTELPFLGEVEDDFGLAKVSLVRALLGYRDRSRVLADSLVKREYNFEEPLKLAELGVEVGQILEFYLEAMDRNPSLLGMGVSDVVRVKIISEDEYAERLRSAVQLKNFTARYRALAEAIRESQQALKELDEAARAGDQQAFEEARKKAEAAHAKAEALADKIGKDFNAFEMEKRLSDIAKEAARKLGTNKETLGQLKLDDGGAAARKQIEQMQQRLGGAQKKAEQAELDAELVRKVGDVMEMASRFKKIYNTQQSIVERMGTIAKEVAGGNTRNSGQLDGLARVQDRNRDALEQFALDLKKRAEALPDDFGQMKLDVHEFLQKLEELDIPDPMHTSSEMARKGKSLDAATNALLALSLLERMMNQPDNGFSSMCRGDGPPKFGVKPDVAGTMHQMLDSLMKRAQGQGKGKTGGAGGGVGGSGQDGFSVAGNDVNIPVYGPDRLAFSETSSGKSTASSSKRGVGVQRSSQKPADQIAPDQHRKSENAKLLPENIPAKYRNAVKRYFSQEDEASTPQS
ncbi:hypothetical protein JIN77_00715 [Verrucomicrobiaceae bacterium R5-34]|nr:hypothetical protein [Verrucomicrobiaceae bacterium R5-34]